MSKIVRVFIVDGVITAIKSNAPDADVEVEVVDIDTDKDDKEAFDKLLQDPAFTDYPRGTINHLEGIDELAELMEEKGYHYDDLESYEGYYRFTYTGMVMPLTFTSLQEIRDYLAELCD